MAGCKIFIRFKPRPRAEKFFNMRCSPQTNSGNALVSVMVLIGVSMLLLGAALSWMSNHKSQTHRYSQYTRSVAAAEAATEKVLVAINHDYKMFDQAYVMKNLDKYRQLVPKASEFPEWRNFRFKDSKGNLGRVDIEYVPSTNILVPVSSQYRGLLGFPNTVRVISHAQEINSSLNVKGSVEQQVQISLIPLFQFAMFYNLDYECTALPLMTVNGPVHCNGDMYLTPHTGLTFNTNVTCSKKILRTAKPGNDVFGKGPVTFKGASDGGVSTLTLPIGTNNSIAAVREVIEIPPPGEDPLSAMGLQRYYNKAHMIVLVSNNTIKVTSGRYQDNFNTTVLLQDFITTNKTFYNLREKKTIRCTDIDIGKFITWKAGLNNTIGHPLPILGPPPQDITVIYVADFRTTNSLTQMGIRLRNGQMLPAEGLTVVSPHPVYTLGHYNCPNNAHLGTTNTTATAPASIVADAITILSTNWNDSAGMNLALKDRAIPANTTVNAAFVAGIVQTTTVNKYSGGVENFPRFLEDWTGRTSTYNGSMVVMFESKHATAPWSSASNPTGIGVYYNPPTRNWSKWALASAP
jgi:hypothetical protein